MTTIEFGRSTQARSWMFDESSLASCRRRAAAVNFSSRVGIGTVRKVASGFHNMQRRMPSVEFEGDEGSSRNDNNGYGSFHAQLSVDDNEALVQFHAHQIQALVGPTAILKELCTSSTVLATAVTFFRRFYLSNSILDINARKMAAACAFFAAKVEEEKIEIGLLSHATAIVQLKVGNAPLCRQELRSVSIDEIMEGERLLMDGLNYEFRCHHPENAIRVLATDFCNFRRENERKLGVDHRDPDESYGLTDRSPPQEIDLEVEDVFQRASEVAYRALIYSDATFLFAPGNIAFAVVAIALGCIDEDELLGEELICYLVSRFPLKPESELQDFSRTVSRIIRTLFACPRMDFKFSPDEACRLVAERAGDLRRVLGAVASIRMQRKRMAKPCDAFSYTRKRSRLEMDFTPPRDVRTSMRKMIKVTPTGSY